MKNRVLLFNGVSTGFANSDNSPSFSLMALSAYLKQNNFEPKLILNRHSLRQIKNLCRDAVAVGFSVYTGNGILQCLKIAKIIRQINPKIALVWGGYHPTLKPEQTLSHPLVDYIVIGQGEASFLELLQFIQHPKSKKISSICGIGFKKNNQLHINPPRLAIDINVLPPLDYFLYDYFYKNTPEISYISSRGCPFNCKFCCSSAFNRSGTNRYMRLTDERVLSDIQLLVDAYHPHHISILDDNFMISPINLKKFVQGYHSRHFTFSWLAFARCDFISQLDLAILKDLSEIKLTKICFGVESGSQKILNFVDKHLRPSQVISSIKNLNKYNILGDFSFINGFPRETISDINKSLNLQHRIMSISPQSTVRFFVFTPLPGTELTKICEKLNYTSPSSLEQWAEYEYHTFSAPWLSSSHQKLVQRIAWASLVDDISLHHLPFLKKTLVFILQTISHWRLNHNFFHLAIDLDIINFIFRRRLSSV